MSALAIDTTLPALVTLAAKATLLMALAAAAVILGRRLSAAARHWTLTLAICGLLGLPLVSGMLPSWTIATVPTASELPARSSAFSTRATDWPEPVSTSVATPAPAVESRWARLPYTAWQMLTFTYAVVAAILLMRLALQFAAARRLVRNADVMDDGEWQSLLGQGRADLGIRRGVRLLRGTADTMPMALGAWQAAIVLPSVADEWSLERRRVVLLHELAHVARRDCLTQLIAGIACAVYWPHPGVWWLAHRLRVERELACDDLVLRAGTPPTEHAGHLLDVAYTLGGARTDALAVGMARRSHLEGRMLAVLDAARNRAMPGRSLRLATTAVAMLAVVPLAVATVSSEPLLMVDVEPGARPASAPTPHRQEPAPGTHGPEPHLKPAPWARAVASLAAQASATLLASNDSGPA